MTMTSLLLKIKLHSKRNDQKKAKKHFEWIVSQMNSVGDTMMDNEKPLKDTFKLDETQNKISFGSRYDQVSIECSNREIWWYSNSLYHSLFLKSKSKIAGQIAVWVNQNCK